jgi:chemotaxis protein MotB
MKEKTERDNERTHQEDERDGKERVETIGRPPADWHNTVNRPVFVIEDSFFRSRTPPKVHWSIAWSDLMMTMFILFLTLFVYQLAHREFLDEEHVEVLAGTSVALPPATQSPPVPFHPISPQISKNSRSLRSLEPRDQTGTVPGKALNIGNETAAKSMASQQQDQSEQPATETGSTIIATSDLKIVDSIDPSTDREIGPVENFSEQKASENQPEQIITDIYDLSKTTLENEKLEQFAAIELIPDKTMRIILTGDLLFDSGKAELTRDARQSLTKLTNIIAKTPYMINVVGHTDSVPMNSQMYPTNWELSVARASRVARFLIEDIGIPGKQIVVSGFSYYRPVRPNNTDSNRRANRRVEIILSKQLPPAVDNTIIN